MKLKEYFPLDPGVTPFIEAYQLYETNEPVVLKAIPNGRVEAWIIGQGALYYKVGVGDFAKSQTSSFYPATSAVTTFHLSPPFRCLNIKFRLNVLGMGFFHHQAVHLSELSYSSFLTSGVFDGIQEMLTFDHLDISMLDKLMLKAFNNYRYDNRIDLALNIITNANMALPIGQLSSGLGMSTRTLERMTMKYFSTSPKKLYKIFRFNNAVRAITDSEKPRLSDALRCGYFDQSHFVKDCKELTTLTPKELIAKLKYSVTDLHVA